MSFGGEWSSSNPSHFMPRERYANVGQIHLAHNGNKMAGSDQRSTESLGSTKGKEFITSSSIRTLLHGVSSLFQDFITLVFTNN
jgi:hypothetical protein